MIAPLVWTMLILCSLYAAVFGGWEGKVGAVLNVGATLATLAVQHMAPWDRINIPVFIVDLCMMAALFALAMKCRVYWPIWAAGFHLLTVSGHIATFFVPEIRWTVYYFFNGMWAIFVQMAMIWGITLDRMYLTDRG